MGLIGYRLWFMGQLDSNVRRPTTAQLWYTRPRRGSAAGISGSKSAVSDVILRAFRKVAAS
jgi:hypothetical protein